MMDWNLEKSTRKRSTEFVHVVCAVHHGKDVSGQSVLGIECIDGEMHTFAIDQGTAKAFQGLLNVILAGFESN